VLTPREVAWEEQKQKLAADVNLADIPNPLPDKLTVRVRDPEQLPAVAERVRQSPLVDEVIDSRAELQTVLSLSHLVRWIGLGAGGLLLLASLILIYNTVRLTIFSRQREVRVMALVGATLRSIRLPFILEGMTQGLVGGALAATLTLLAAALLSDYMTQQWVFLRDLPPGMPPLAVLIGLPTLGALMGGLCAWWATLRYVRI
jgi:cell division transport system permease protein